MRKLGDLMKDLGFNKDASVEVQKAFIRHLVSAANVSELSRVSKKIEPQSEQLSFALEEESAPRQEEIHSTELRTRVDELARMPMAVNQRRRSR